MTADWPHLRLGDLVEIRHGWPFRGELFSDDLTGRPIVVNIGNFRYTGGFRFESTQTREYRGPYPQEYELIPGEILVVMTCQTAGGEILGIPARVPDDGRIYLHNQRLGRVLIRDRQRLDAGYLYWAFLSPVVNRALVASASGTKILHTSPSRIEAVEIRLPSLNEQRRIASVLDDIDNKIELNRRMSETLEETARGVFKSWFVDFDPVRAKAEGCDTGLPAHLADLFPGQLDKAAGGPLPAGWSIGSLGEIATERRRGIAPESIEPATPYVALEHMPRHSIALTEWTAPVGVASGKHEFRRGDILFGKLRPYFHKVGVAPVDGVCSTDIVVITPRSPEWFGLVLGFVTSNRFVESVSASATGTKMPRTSWAEMCRQRLAIPPAPLAAAYTAFMSPAIERLIVATHESRTLAAIRDALLPKLISGEIRVPQAERILEAASS